VRAAGRGNPSINLSDGVQLQASYSGAVGARRLLAAKLARPCALASADFDEDGVADLVTGYWSASGNILTLHRGNIDSIYPNSPEARQRKARGEFTDSAFLADARLFEVAQAPDFIAAGDFDADGHWDAAVAARGSKSLYLLSGDGRGNFTSARRIDLTGEVTALVSGEINRADGLADIVVAVTGEGGPKALVFEGPEGALNATAETFSLPAQAGALALGQLDDEHTLDLAVGAGSELLIVHGRDRQLSFDAARQAEVRPAIVDRHVLSFDVISMAAGDFTASDQTNLAMLASDGTVYLTDAKQLQAAAHGAKKKKKDGKSNAQSVGRWPGASGLACARVSIGPADDLLVIDAASQRIHIAGQLSGKQVQTADSKIASLEMDGDPVAVLPMRLNGDALSDLVILQSGHSAPAVVKTRAAMTFVVTNTSGFETGSIGDAILQANANPGADVIVFNIPGPGPYVIDSLGLPLIVDPVTIDGTTQPGFAGIPIIKIHGQPFSGTQGMAISAGNSLVRGLVLQSFRNGVELQVGGNNIIEGNFIGVDVIVEDGSGNTSNGVFIISGLGNLIGGTTPQARNVISSNFIGTINAGILIGGSATFNFVRGNYIGTDVQGTAKVGNAFGIRINGSGNLIGGTEAGVRNIISGNRIHGIDVRAFGNQIEGNYIGTDVNGTAALGNGFNGLNISANINTIGGTAPNARNIISGNGMNGVSILSIGQSVIQGNFIGTGVTGAEEIGNSEDGINITSSGNNMVENAVAFNGGHGVRILTGRGNSILSNRIFSNAGLGINLGPFGDGVTLNDPCDGDVGANDLQNFPVLTSATSNQSSVTIQGTLNSTPDVEITLEFFANDACDPSGFGEGQIFIGSTTVRTGDNCNASFSVTFPFPVRADQVVTATATGLASNTSEFSECVAVVEVVTFDLCLQDESNGSILRVDSATGQYQFTDCSGVAVVGTGTLSVRGCVITLQHTAEDRRVLARIDTCAKSGTASIQLFSQGRTFTITDRNTANNTCACTGG
jgi:parallel beta-helix repeat protein